MDSAAIMSAFGLYELYVSSLANFDLQVLIPAAVGLAVGALVISMVMNLLIKKSLYRNILCDFRSVPCHYPHCSHGGKLYRYHIAHGADGGVLCLGRYAGVLVFWRYKRE